MRPILVELFNFPLYSYGVMITLAFSVGLVLALRNGKYWGIAEGFLVDLAALVMLAAIIAARLTYVVMAWEDYVQEPLRIFALREGGLSFQGGLLAGFIVGVWYTRRNGYSPWVVAEAAAPSLAMGLAITRIGCLLNGCCYGIPADLPWALYSSRAQDVPRHPTQLYESLFGLAMFLWLWSKRGRVRPGDSLGIFFIAYGFARFIIEFFRAGAPTLGPLTWGQWASLLLILLTGLVLRKSDRS
ncbi:MAG: prolipoprotein diacylglyceryl transferase [Limnochordia bacterium]|nr:prolipoprotein diacylglyceryl transferase [Bacillota bacterium]